ncbi:MAG: TPM domain-containing protein [Cyclobacteriaceae bacterium]|nr:TPM domain-containing protein [Cyclobacteriaceae bacterium]
MRGSFTLLRFSFFVILILAGITVQAQRAVPPHNTVWVHDEANVLSPATKARLEAMLQAHRDSTSNQVAVLIVSSLDGEDINGYAVRVFEAWKLGQKGKDNGVLFLVAMQDRQMRIEVGYGLEGVLTDALSSRINRNEVAPYFRQGNYEAGIQAGVEAIIKAVAGEYKNDNPVTKKRGKKSSWSTLIFIVLLVILMSGRNRRGGGMGGYWTAAMLGNLLGGRGSSGGSWGGGGSFGGGGFSGGGGSSNSW